MTDRDPRHAAVAQLLAGWAAFGELWTRAGLPAGDDDIYDTIATEVLHAADQADDAAARAALHPCEQP